MSQFHMEILESLSPEQQNLLKELEKEAFPNGGAVDEWSLVPLARYGRLLVFKQDEETKPVAVCELIRDFSDPSQVYIFGFYVRPKHHGKGIGTLFLEQVLSYLRKEGFHTVSLTVEPDNVAAKALYKRVGFIEKERMSSEYGVGADRVYMVNYLVDG